MKIPPADHAALESRLEALMDDPEADQNDVIAILRTEFEPEQGEWNPAEHGSR